MTEPQPKSDDEAPEATQDNGETSDHAGQIAGLKDQVLRALADAENTRRRAQKEREDTAKYAVSDFAKEMLNVADNFQRAMAAMPENVTDPVVKNLVTGIQATERQLLAVLERFGIKKIDPLGQAFDPHFHRAMSEVNDP